MGVGFYLIRGAETKRKDRHKLLSVQHYVEPVGELVGPVHRSIGPNALVWSPINMRKAKIIALKGGLLGLPWSAVLGWMTWLVYDDREFDRVWMMATHAILFLTATVLLSLAGFFSNLKPQRTGPLIFVATGIFVIALVLGSLFALTEFSGIGVPILLVPSALFTVVAGSALAFTARVEHLPR